MKKSVILFFFAVLSPFSIASAQADAADKGSVVDAAMDAGFSELERQIIERYYHGSEKQADRDEHSDDGKQGKDKTKGDNRMPPGLAKKAQLPPGLAKQLERNGTLPPGLAKRDLPSDLDRQLPAAVDTLERTIVDTSVVLVEKATGRIVDIIADVVTGN